MFFSEFSVSPSEALHRPALRGIQGEAGERSSDQIFFSPNPMEIIFGLDRLKRRLINPVVTLGNFDGVHLGHQIIFRKVKEEASKVHGEGVVITFEPHPLKVLSPESFPPLLTPFRKKMMLIEQSGMDTVLCIEFTPAFAQLSAFQFVRDILVEKLRAEKVVIGYNYHFGKGKEGDAETLKLMGSRLHLEVEIVDPMIVENTVVSSSKIRDLIKDGNVEEASKFLGRPYPILGKVIEGAKRGHLLLGFPTANLAISDEMVPHPGVYAVHILWNQQALNGVANVGWNPTFEPSPPEGQAEVSIEIYILEFNRDIYGEELQVNFLRRIRDEARFDSPAELSAQIQEDVRWAQENVFNNKNIK
jgi:riboflavin kinase/FMN adenylyltransferase